jgi:hypothetical protein
VLVTVATTDDEQSCSDFEKKIHMTALLRKIPITPMALTASIVC